MIVNSNLNALHIYNVLDKQESELKKSLKNVSSGSRLNSAANAPAEYAISQKMRAQIRGLEQAKRNAKNGTSMLQTAERALDSTTDILARIKEITLESANDTASASDREIMQREIGNLAQALDEIAYNTDFNEISLLDGHFEISKTQSAISEMRTNAYSQTWTSRNMILRPGQISIISISSSQFLAGDKVQINDPIGGPPLTFEFEKEGMPAKAGHIGVEIGATFEKSIQNFVDAVAAASENRIDFSITKTGSRFFLKWPGHTNTEFAALFNRIQNVVEETEKGGHYEFDLKENFTRGDTIEIIGHTFTAGGNGNFSFQVGRTTEESLQNLLQSLQKACGNQIPASFTLTATRDRISDNMYNLFRRLSTDDITTISFSDFNSICDAAADAAVAGKSRAEICNTIRSTIQRAGYSDADAAVGGSDIMDGLALCAQCHINYLDLTGASGVVSSIRNRPYDSSPAFRPTITNSDAFEKAAWHSCFAILNSIGNGASVQEATTAALNAGAHYYDNVGSPPFADIMESKLSFNGGLLVYSAKNFMADCTEKLVNSIHKQVPFPDDFSRMKFSVEGNTLHIQERFSKTTSHILGRDIAPPVLHANEHRKGTSLNLQIGTKSNQSIQVNLAEMSAKALGIIVSPLTNSAGRAADGISFTVDVLTQKTAKKSIDVIDEAVQKVVMQKANLGSIQRRLEYTTDNLTTAETNVTEAESTISDTNLAKETLHYQTRRILSQAGQAMLAQATSAPERVLQLLQ